MTSSDQLARPRRRWLVLGVVLAGLLVLGMVRIAIPTSTDVRIVQWFNDPANPVEDVTAMMTSVPTDEPLALEATTDGRAIRRIDFFTTLAGGAAAPDLQMRVRDARTGRTLVRHDVPGHDVVDGGLTIFYLPEYDATRRLRVELVAEADERRAARVELPGYARPLPGFMLEPRAEQPQLQGLAVRAFIEIKEPSQRLDLMVDRSIARWSSWNALMVPIALIGFLVCAVGSAGYVVALALDAAGSTRARIGSFAIAMALLTPLVIYVLQHRAG